ncbi:MAG: hypothetical protein ACI9IO_001334 [Cyanobium sp.]|jgi:hypothetical protein
MDLGKRMGHGQAQVLPALEPRADAAATAITSGLVAREPPGVLLLDLAGELDLEEIHAVYWQQDPHGEKACWEDAAFRVLTGNQQPDHSRISDFRRRHLPAPRSRLVPFIFLLVAFAIKLAQRFGPPLAVTADFWWVLISGDWSFPLTWQGLQLTPQ